MPVLKTISIGDIHGSDAWMKIDFEKYDRIIFVGDYTDHFTRSNNKIIKNLLNILSLKRKYEDKVVLLLGNHDLAYHFLGDSFFMCTGHREMIGTDLHDIFMRNRYSFQAAYQLGNYLWTHAGMTYDFYHEMYIPLKDRFQKRFQMDPVPNDGEILSLMAETEAIRNLSVVSFLRKGSSPYGGIFWADQSEHYNDFQKGKVAPFHQICGHSRVGTIKTILTQDNSASITLIDCLDTVDQFYEKEIEVNDV